MIYLTFIVAESSELIIDPSDKCCDELYLLSVGSLVFRH
jgi:hypothetical protein